MSSNLVMSPQLSTYEERTRCRVSGSSHLVSVLNLGEQALTGVFPRTPDEVVDSGPLELVWCPESGLLQLGHSFDPTAMYGDNYGYRSGLNQSMVRHLTSKVAALTRCVTLEAGDTVIDIGSNDATLLKAYNVPHLRRVGVDPTGEKFRSYYPPDIELIADFFSGMNVRNVTSSRAKIVTSIAMFYDLEDPVEFAREVHDLLDEQGIWHFEQSYMPSMLRMNSYDTVCHEHVEYYSLSSVVKILEAADLQPLDVVMNDINGGSFAVTAARSSSKFTPNSPVINWLLDQELRLGLSTPAPFRAFEDRAFKHRASLVQLIRTLNDDGKTVFGYGASTKGNVLLQFCGFSADDIPCIAEVNADKFGCYTPGTHIPIVSEKEARENEPDYFLVLPWHFKAGIREREKEFLAEGGRMIFPFPEIEVV